MHGPGPARAEADRFGSALHAVENRTAPQPSSGYWVQSGAGIGMAKGAKRRCSVYERLHRCDESKRTLGLRGAAKT